MSLPPARQYRSYFWPALLILVGLFALLVNAGVLQTDRLGLVFDLWPVILIVIGLELIVRRTVQGSAGDVAGMLIVVIAVGGAIAYVGLAPNPGATHSLDVSGAAGSVENASVEVDAGATTITVTGSSSLGGDLYRAHIDYSGAKPDVSFDTSNGELKISQGNGSSFFNSRHFNLQLQISSNIPWKISTNTGASTETYNVSTVNLRSLEINTGASREEVTLGTPSGVVPITINGGALTAHLHRPAGTSASVSVSGGAVSLDFDGHQQHAIGDLNQSSGSSSDMYRVEVNGGACTVTMDANGSGG